MICYGITTLNARYMGTRVIIRFAYSCLFNHVPLFARAQPRASGEGAGMHLRRTGSELREQFRCIFDITSTVPAIVLYSIGTDFHSLCRASLAPASLQYVQLIPCPKRCLLTQMGQSRDVYEWCTA